MSLRGCGKRDEGELGVADSKMSQSVGEFFLCFLSEVNKKTTSTPLFKYRRVRTRFVTKDASPVFHELSHVDQGSGLLKE